MLPIKSKNMAERQRCKWVKLKDALELNYHDLEWGVPLFDDQKLFEYLLLDTFQAGLSWNTILHKRENFKTAFDQFNPQKIAAYRDKKIESLCADAGIIRNTLKIKASILNA